MLRALSPGLPVLALGTLAATAAVYAIVRRRRRLRLPLLCEHVNLNIPCEDAAKAFYLTALGGAIQPKSSNWRQLHVNAGASQFHLLHSMSPMIAIPPGKPMKVPQRWPGLIRLWTTERLADVHRRLLSQLPQHAHTKATAAPVLDDSIAVAYGIDGRWPEQPCLSADGARLLCACPWGNRYEIQRSPNGYEAEGTHPGGSGGLVAMRSLVHPVRPGHATSVAAFFERVLDCPAVLETDTGHSALSCTIVFASGQQLRFIETADSPSPMAYSHDEPTAGYHLAFYAASHDAFGEAFRRSQAAGALYLNPRFEGGPPEFGNAMSYELAMSCGQFRVRDLCHPNTGHLGLMLELEVRSPRHISCPLPSAP